MIIEQRKLPPERKGITHKVIIGGTDVYIRTGEFLDGGLGEVFITVNKEGHELRAYDGVAIAMSIGLQRGVPLKAYVDKFKHQRMEPGGVTSDPKIPMSHSILDYLAHWLEARYLTREKH